MNRNNFQLFLSLMDTIHDYGDTGRTKTNLLKKGSMDDEENEIEETNVKLKHISFNPAFIIDFLILGYVHNMFKEMLDLDKKQLYLKTSNNCLKIKKNNATNVLYEQKNVVKQKICQNFYFPTYGDRFFFRSPSPEEFTKAILTDYLQFTGINYGDVLSVSINDKDNNELRNKNTIDLMLGNIGLGEIIFDNNGKFIKGPKDWYKKGNNTNYDNLKKDFARYTYLIQYENKCYFPRDSENNKVKEILSKLPTNTDTLKLSIDNMPSFMKTKSNNKIKKMYELYENDIFKDGKLYYEIQIKPSGIFSMNEPGKMLYDTLCKIFDCQTITYVADANQLNDKWLYCNPKSIYRGKFTEYDSYKTTAQQVGGMDDFDFDSLLLTQTTNPKNNVSQINTTSKTSNILSEFQEYSLKKEAGELILFDELGIKKKDVNSINDTYWIYFKYDSKERLIKTKGDDSQDDKQKIQASGLSLFLLVFNEINRKTFGNSRASLPKKERKLLKEKLDNIGLKAIRKTYKISLQDTIEQNNSKTNSSKDVLYLSRNDFILALLDLKRSMDYLYVKACSEANKKTDENRKYIFVSNDRSAICYSLMLGNPCVHTPPKPTSGFKRGEQSITIYNPPKYTTTPNTTFPQTTRWYQNTQNQSNEDLYIPHILPNTINVVSRLSNPNNKIRMCEEFDKKIKHIKDRLENGYTVSGKLEDPFNQLKNIYLKTHTKNNEFSSQLNEFIDIIRKKCNDSKIGGGIKDDILDYEIPIDNNIESFLDEDEPFYDFLQFYSTLTPTIKLFWFITYRSLFYFLYGDYNKFASNREYFPTTNKMQSQGNHAYNPGLRSISNDGQYMQARK